MIAATSDTLTSEAHPHAGKPAWSAVFAMTMCVTVLVASEFMPASLLSPIAHDLGLTAGQAGQAISISGFFALITSLLITTVLGSLDRRIVLVGMALLLAVSGALVALAPNYLVLMVGRALLGVTIGGFWSLNISMTMRLLPAASVPLGLAISNGGTALAWTVSAPLSSYVGALIGWRATFFCVVPLALAAALWQALALPQLRPQAGRQSGSLGRVLRNRTAVLGFAAVSTFFMGQFALYTYLRPFLERVTHVEATTLSALLLVIGLAGLAGNFVISKVVRTSLHATLVSIPLVMAGLAFALPAFGASVAVVAVLLAAWGLVSTPAPIAWGTWLTRILPNDAEAGGGLQVASIQFAIMLGASLGGLVIDASGPAADFFGSSAILLLAALLAFFGSRSAHLHQTRK